MVVEFSENRFLHALPNTENTFSANFPKHKQTIENIFLFVKLLKFSFEIVNVISYNFKYQNCSWAKLYNVLSEKI